MKTVLIIGGGPAGLVAAKTLLRWPGNPFKVTLFEQAERIGGMWRARKGEEGDKCSPEMRTNLSRFTVAFTDLPWQSVPLDEDGGFSSASTPPMFPKAHQVGLYLEEYARRFIPEGVITCNRRVAEIKLEGTPPKWTVSSRQETSSLGKPNSRNSVFTDTFDFLIVASGFFSTPNVSREVNAKTQHSAKFRHVSSFSDTPGNIVVIGGGISGSEAAATAAFQISNAKYAPSNVKPAWSESKTYHVFDRPFYVLPRYVAPNSYDNEEGRFNSAPNFLPVDLNLYNLARRGDSEINAFNGPVTPERAPRTHEFLRSMLGGDTSDLGYEQLVYRADQTQYPAFTGIADTYGEFVRSGLIVPIRGRATKDTTKDGGIRINVSQTGTWSSKFKISDQLESIKNVTGIIEATGYSVDFDYGDAISDLLDHDRNLASTDRVPFLLSNGSIFAPKVPEMAFIGFYEGPYWAVMEMQARKVAEVWSENEMPDTDVSLAAKVREGIEKCDLSIPQLWMADYVGLVEELARDVGCRRNDGCFAGQTGPLFPARYTNLGNDLNAAEQTVREVRDLLDASENDARFVAAAAFRAMQGEWKLNRKIISRNTSAPGGSLDGTAHFHPREPTASGFSEEYLYIEEGTFTMDNGYAFTAKRRYIYRYSELKDVITAWFVQEDGETVDKFFNQLVFERPTGEDQGWAAKGDHWCDPDTYKSLFEFRFRGCGLEKLGITYDVRGPNKDYMHESSYTRFPVPKI